MTTTTQIKINYRKIGNLEIDSLAKQYEPTADDLTNNYNPFSISEVQSFSPLYHDFFVLNESNYNRIGLNHQHYLDGSAIYPPVENYHVKCSPLLDPIHYLVGKYQKFKNLNVLPTLTNQSDCFAKIANKQNASYVDGFFSYLCSRIKHTHNMLNAVDFYGSYLAIQKVFKATVTDDLDYLYQSNYFMNRLGKGVNISCRSSTFDDFTGIGSRANRKRLVLEGDLDIADLCVDVIGFTGCDSGAFSVETSFVGESFNPSAHSPSKPPSYENHSIPEQSNVDSEEQVVDVSCEYAKSEKDDSSSSSSSSSTVSDDDGSSVSESEHYSTAESEESESTDESEESEAYAYIDNFPTNLIFLEKCDGTLDSLFMNQEIDETTGAACLMQIIMSLITFQKAFQLTHNDLHTNNIMYVNTDVEFLYYKYGNCFYRVPTYGKIFKIIDFGRAIYRFQNQIYCSDSFAPKGDAHSQYNTEPFFNEKRPRVEANPSFDLCRLGTSIYDFIIPDENDERDEFQETIYRWCQDDNGKNIMYRRDGEERYPGFKLYKVIARNVHAHTPQEQLKFPIFSQFAVGPEDAASIDEQEVRRNGLNIDLVEKEYV